MKQKQSVGKKRDSLMQFGDELKQAADSEEETKSQPSKSLYLEETKTPKTPKVHNANLEMALASIGDEDPNREYKAKMVMMLEMEKLRLVTQCLKAGMQEPEVDRIL